MTKGSPGYKKRLVYIQGARVVPSSTKGDLVTLYGNTKNVTEKDLATKFASDVNGMKGVKNRMTIG